jgi:hypothetical protein
MDILGFDEFKLLLEAEDPLSATPSLPASPASDVPPPSTPTPAPSDLGTAPAALPPDPNAPAAGPEEPTGKKFIFIQDAHLKKWHGDSDNEGGTKRFTEYEVSDEELGKWLETHDDDDQAELIKAALDGKRPMPQSVYHKFKKEVLDGTLGADKGTIDVIFDSDKNYDNPTTSNLDVVFLKSTKGESD